MKRFESLCEGKDTREVVKKSPRAGRDAPGGRANGETYQVDRRVVGERATPQIGRATNVFTASEPVYHFPQEKPDPNPNFKLAGETMKTLLIAAALALLPLAAPSWAEIQTKPVQFPKGTSSATIKGLLKGEQTVDYTLRARAGQTMTVTFRPSNDAAYFNVLPPGSTGEAIFIGSTSGNEWTGTLPADGEYRVRTYLMRSAARRNEAVSYTLTVGITGGAHGAAPAGKASHAERAGQGQFDASGNIPCAESRGQPMGQCRFQVARESGGSASVKVTLPSGRTRFIFFEKGRAVSADLSQADGDMSFKATKEADLFMIRAGQERYEIPEAVVFGG
ncbi:hypothetical protein [Accumulibacter sp.]|uniref:hypothetical protein n=1 Tax=Accumulibacter sp. TaxID=2053492 RepID=UPI0025FD7774|nr:hypothetical protein [Accumulibacter sp.]MCM8597019.1 hypothetical protein [Accumulibacter sp.]MCM8626235.1 hypothetical protein [Accumulibacter sp.]MDS4051168.1 hypothetical protein [Accumulibacter sp.]